MTSHRSRPPEVTELKWRDPPLAKVATPKGRLRMTLSVGSGLTRRAGDPPGRVWGLGDRGPNISVNDAIRRYGLDHFEGSRDLKGAKVLPLVDFQPALAELQVSETRVELLRTLPLSFPTGPMSGRNLPDSPQAEMEPLFDLDGRPLPPDPAGADPEAVAALPDGGFWIAEEYAPSLMQIDPSGVVRRRWTPIGVTLPHAESLLPATAVRRRMNRGFEGLAISRDDRWLYAAFQSAHEGRDPTSTVLWKLDAADGSLAAEHIYPFDAPESFTADARRKRVKHSHLKVCELVALDQDRLLVLERVSRSARLYEVDLARAGPLVKRLVFSTEDHPEVAPGLEGVTLLSACELLIATDNDFGTEGLETRFYRLTYDAPFV